MPDLSIRARESLTVRQIRTCSGRLHLRAAPMPDPPESPDEVADPEDDADDETLVAATAFGIDGYACVTDEPYEMEDWLGPYTETVCAGAFTKTLLEKADVRLLLNHGGIPLARTKSGTLELDEDPTGLHAVAPALDAASTLAQNVRSALTRGDLDEMSFMFRIVRQQWSPDFMQLNIQEVELFDVSIVTFPANPATAVGLCSVDLAAAPEADARAALATLSRRFAPAALRATPRRTLAERVLQTL